MGRKATKTLPIRPDTKDLVDEQKPEGETYDRWIRREILERERDG